MTSFRKYSCSVKNSSLLQQIFSSFRPPTSSNDDTTSVSCDYGPSVLFQIIQGIEVDNTQHVYRYMIPLYYYSHDKSSPSGILLLESTLLIPMTSLELLRFNCFYLQFLDQYRHIR